MQDAALTNAALEAFDDMRHELTTFMTTVRTWFETHPRLTNGNTPLIHSVKSRLKNREHLRAKIQKKSDANNVIDGANLGRKVTDLSGVRVLHLHQEQIRIIHEEILRKIERHGDWFLHESPRAYTWDPERQNFYQGIGFEVHVKPSSYTSVHYTVRPREDSPLCCEIQVRTLFEEIWGEVDHALNYPKETDNVACREQILVLGKVVGAGSRLVDSIYRTVAAESVPVVEQAEQPENPSQNVSVVIPVPVVLNAVTPDAEAGQAAAAEDAVYQPAVSEDVVASPPVGVAGVGGEGA